MERQKYAFDSIELQQLIGGRWYPEDAVDPEPGLFFIDYFVTGTGLVEKPRSCFIAWDEYAWLQTPDSPGHFTALTRDAHEVLAQDYENPQIKNNLNCVIAQRPIEKLSGLVPQLIVDNPYDCISILAAAARAKADDNCTIIAVTGAAGISAATSMIHCLLENEADCITNLNGQNSRTGVPLCLAAAGRFDPGFRKDGDMPNVCILEVADSALWKSGGSISRIVRPHIAIVTDTQLTQNTQTSTTTKDIAAFSGKICAGIVDGGYALVCRQIQEYDTVIWQVTGYGATPVSYGLTPDCDSYVVEYDTLVPEGGEDNSPILKIKAFILGESIAFDINGAGETVVLSSIAALTAVKLAGFDISQAAALLVNYDAAADITASADSGADSARSPVTLSPPPPPAACVLAFSADNNQIVYQKGDPAAEYRGGLGLPLFLYHLLNLIRKNELTWLDEVTVNEKAESESAYPNSLGLKHQEKAPLLTLFKAAVICNAPDAISALSEHIKENAGKSSSSIIVDLIKTGRSWGIPESALRNTTGRYSEDNPQFFNALMLLKAAIQLLSYDVYNLLSHNNVSFRDKYLTQNSVLDMPPVSRSLTFATEEKINTVCMCEYGDETVYIAVGGAETPLHRDQLALEAIHRARAPLPAPSSEFIQTDKNVLTLCGDTYCGERYTKWRKARNIDDPMQRFGDAGYAFSFEKVAPLLSQDSFNIVNSECVLSPVYDKTQQTGRYIDFVLGAHPEKTIACYKEVNIDAVMLANNHSMDFGPVGCRQTYNYFADAGLNPFGMGGNIDEAELPLQLDLRGRQAIVFNAYCYFLEKRHNVFRHYCLGANPGTAFGTVLLDDVSLWRRIRVYRESFPDAYIIFSPHWSSDFSTRHSHLRPIAERAFDAGADLIIGHGPHIPIGAERIDGKLCFYSIGNFVFNTTGIDLDASGQSPYGIVARLDFSREDPLLRMYPIYAHNLKTFFQPYPVTDQSQFEEFASSIIGLDMFSTEKDEIGYYITIS